MAPWLRVHTARAEDLSLVLSTSSGASQPSVTQAPGDLIPDPWGTVLSHTSKNKYFKRIQGDSGGTTEA